MTNEREPAPGHGAANATEESGAALDVTIVVVSDYEPGAKSWRDEINMLDRLSTEAAKRGRGFPVVIAENERQRHAELPDAFERSNLDLSFVYGDSDRSADLKDLAVSGVTTEWVAVFEADSLPEPGWFARVEAAALREPGHAIFHGRTFYGEETMWQRALNLIDRSFDDRGSDGASHHISNNAALYRTKVLKAFPYPAASTPFASNRTRSEQIFAAGHTSFFVREARARHAIGGLSFVWDVQRHTGFADMVSQGKPSLQNIPRRILGRLRRDLRHAVSLGPEYLRLTDWPLYLALLVFIRAPQLSGMFEALGAPDTLHASAYR